MNTSSLPWMQSAHLAVIETLFPTEDILALVWMQSAHLAVIETEKRRLRRFRHQMQSAHLAVIETTPFTVAPAIFATMQSAHLAVIEKNRLSEKTGGIFFAAKT